MLQEWSADFATFRFRQKRHLLLPAKDKITYYHAWSTILVQFARRTTRPRTTSRGLRGAIDGLIATGARIRLPYYLTLVVRICLKAGRLNEGFEILQEAMTTARENHEHWWDAELFRLRGELGLLHGMSTDDENWRSARHWQSRSAQHAGLSNCGRRQVWRSYGTRQVAGSKQSNS